MLWYFQVAPLAIRTNLNLKALHTQKKTKNFIKSFTEIVIVLLMRNIFLNLKKKFWSNMMDTEFLYHWLKNIIFNVLVSDFPIVIRVVLFPSAFRFLLLIVASILLMLETFLHFGKRSSSVLVSTFRTARISPPIPLCHSRLTKC